MKNIRPCPICGGEVEVVRLADKITYEEVKDEETKRIKKVSRAEKQYRIQCLRCKKLVAKGTGFDCETPAEAEERIHQYEAEMNRLLYNDPMGDTRRVGSMYDRKEDVDYNLSEDDEENELHDAGMHVVAR